jgi:hypothetical protein
MLAGEKIKEYFKKRTLDALVGDDQSMKGADRSIPMLGRVIFCLIERGNREHVVGDLEEEYWTIIIVQRGLIFARCWWWRQVFGIAGSYIWKYMRRALGLTVMRSFLRR